MRPVKTRVVVVGGGVIGTMHAYLALRRGYDVIHIEREAAPRGASVRNFGLVWVSGRAAGDELALAQRARDLWQGIAAEVPGIGFRAAGSLTAATTPQELTVLENAAASKDAEERGFRLLDPGEARIINPALRGDFLGALHCGRDAVVEPRSAVAALRSAMNHRDGYLAVNGTEITGYDESGVIDSRGRRWTGDLIVLATGANYGGVATEHLRAAPLRRCRLQMMQTAPFDEVVPTALADGDSLRYYPAFADAGIESLQPQASVAAARHMQLLLVQRLDGSLTIGDTHAYDEPFDFDVVEEPYDHLRRVAEGLLGRPIPPTVHRWAGVYSQMTGDAGDAIYHRAQLTPGTVVVTGPGGRGMTCSPAIAEDTLLALAS